MRHRIAAFMLAILLATPVWAGRSCEPSRPTQQAVASALTLAQRTMDRLEAEHERGGTNVVLLARAGQNLTRYGLHYSHFGFAYRTVSDAGKPVWRIVHKLNACGTAEAAVYRQGLGEFFLDDLWRYEAAYEVPDPAVQAKLLPLLADDNRVAVLHTRAYSIVSYVWGTRYQQSNQWAIETLAMAMELSIRNREQAQAWLRFKGYEPTVLRLGPLERLGGRITSANVAFDDHPNEKRFSDRIETVTVDSVFAWLTRSGLAGPPVSLLP